MKGDWGVIVGSMFGGIVAVFFVTIIFLPFVNGHKELFVSILILLCILWLIVTLFLYRIIYIKDFNALSNQNPYGIVEWAYENHYIKSVEDSSDKLSFSQKKDAVKFKDTIHKKDIEIKEDYNKIAFSYPLGLEAFVTKTQKTEKLVVIHHKEEIKRLDKEENQRIRKERLQNEFDAIKKLYPLGITIWMRNNLITSTIGCEQIEKAQREITNIAQFEEQERSRIANYEAKERKKRELDSWKSEQSRFARHCRDLRDKMLDKWGCFYYDIDVSISRIHTDDKYRVWQIFAHSYCSEPDLDYTYSKQQKNNAIQVSQNKYPLSDKQIEHIAEYINKIHEEEKCSLYFCPPQEESLSATYGDIYARMINNLYEGIDDNELYAPFFRNTIISIEEWVKNINRRVIIIDVCTNNTRLKDFCIEIATKAVRKRPLINFISLYKEYDREEMKKKIEDDKKKFEEQEAKKEREKDAHRRLINAVSSWKTLPCGLPYYYLFYYYPTTCDFEATEIEWTHRRLVWNFKNDPDKNISYTAHNIALNHVVSNLKALLIMTFGEDLLHMLTLVCLPASTQVKNEARYKAFSEKLCYETGMKDGYDHTVFIEDGISKNSPSNPTGHSIQPKVTFDNWFKGKCVLLFDDVVTKGETMMRYKHILEEVGVIVVGGLCIGQTKHTRVEL